MKTPVPPFEPVNEVLSTGPTALNPGGDPLFIPAPLALGVIREPGSAIADQEEVYWRENHFAQPYGSQTDYEKFEPAYRVGYEGYLSFGNPQKSFAEVESQLQESYEACPGELPWIQARPATLAAWRHAQNHALRP